VHFGNLAARGRPNAPISVCESLSAAGYDVRCTSEPLARLLAARRDLVCAELIREHGP
jgi:hypothetical protein